MGIINRKPSLTPIKSRELIKVENSESSLKNIQDTDLPDIIGGQIEKYKELDIKYNESIMRAEKAAKSANSAYAESAGFFNRKNAIEAMQSAQLDSAKANMANVEFQKVSLEFHKKCAEINKFLFMLGVSNIALNRTTVRQLELKLQGASKEKISELVQSEIKNVIEELKAQQDILEKQKNIDIKLKEVHQDQKSQIEKVKEHENLIDKTTKKISNYARKLTDNAKLVFTLNEKMESYEKIIKKLNRSNKQFDDKIESLELKIEKMEKSIKILRIVLFLSCGFICISLLLSVLAMLK
jgi:hypothetical protein